MNSMHDRMVYCREPRGPGVELGSSRGSATAAQEASWEAALTPLALRLLASLHRRFNSRRLALAAVQTGDWGRNAYGLSIRGEGVAAALLDFAVWVCRAQGPAVRVAPVSEPRCDVERQLWVDVFAAAEDALCLRRGTVAFRTSNDSRSESVK